jgi:uncharacterized protein (DUF58 family)
VRESSHVGLICFSDIKELYLKPLKGHSQAYEIINGLSRLKPKSLRTNLNKAISYALNVIRRRSVVILISDFIDDNYFEGLKALARKHDLVVIHISDKLESRLPGLGIIPVIDKESGRTLWINTSSEEFRQRIRDGHKQRKEELEKHSRKHQINFLSLDTADDYVPQLLKLFKVRNKSLKSS